MLASRITIIGMVLALLRSVAVAAPASRGATPSTHTQPLAIDVIRVVEQPSPHPTPKASPKITATKEAEDATMQAHIYRTDVFADPASSSDGERGGC